MKEKPKSFDKRFRGRILKYVESVEYGEVKLPIQSQRDFWRFPGKWRFAEAREAKLNLDSGTWEGRELWDGTLLWRLRIISKGAKAINLGITTFKLPKDGKLWIYSPSGIKRKEFHGPYTIEDALKGQLWTPCISGEEIVVELNVKGYSKKDADILIGKVNHVYNWPSISRTCTVDIDQSFSDERIDKWREQIQLAARSVAWFHVEGTYIGSGTLLNSVRESWEKPAPYFLSADHTNLSGKNVHTMVVYWNYQWEFSGYTGTGNFFDNQRGATYRAGSEKNVDFVLVELDKRPDPESNVYYSGWDAGWFLNEKKPQLLFGIHHPQSKNKSISVCVRPVKLAKYRTGESVTGKYWRIPGWEYGSTEPGSSGSGLWAIDDDGSFRLVGQLRGGWAKCRGHYPNDKADWYGMFAYSWPGDLKPNTYLAEWLDWYAKGVKKLDGFDPKSR